MDIRCPLCGEPWEIDSLHEQVESEHPDKPWYVVSGKAFDDEPVYSATIYDSYFSAIRKKFSVEGCAVFNAAHGPISKKNALFGDLMELAGDDIDFAASMIEDAERFGLID